MSMRRVPELHYAARPPWHHRWRSYRLLVAFALLIALATSSRWFPPVARRAQTLYWQRACMTHAANPDRVVFTSDAAEAARLVAADSSYKAFSPVGAGFVPREWQEFFALHAGS